MLFVSADFTKEPVFAISVKKEKYVSVYCQSECILSGVTQEIKPVVVNYKWELSVLFEYQGRILKSVKETQFTRPKYAYFGTIAKYELITNLADTYKFKTYGTLTQRGVYRTLLMSEIPQKEEISEPEPMPEEKSAEKKYDEIIKLLENKSEYEILANIMNKLNEMEKTLEEIKYCDTFKQC